MGEILEFPVRENPSRDVLECFVGDVSKLRLSHFEYAELLLNMQDYIDQCYEESLEVCLAANVIVASEELDEPV